jgi:dTDP-4-dehydrorhamnose reductase
VSEFIARSRPALILLPAAISAVDYIETHHDEAWLINVEGVEETVIAAKKIGAFLVFYSTDYVFDGFKGPYDEEARTNPLNFYGKTKLEAEKVIGSQMRNFLIIRTCSIYGYEKGGKNFAMQVWERLKEGRNVKVPDDQYGTPTYVEDLSRATLSLVNGKNKGIFNVVGPDYVNRVDFARAVADAFDFKSAAISGVSTEQLRQSAPRPKKGGLKIEKLLTSTGIRMLPLKEGLIKMRENINKENA